MMSQKINNLRYLLKRILRVIPRFRFKLKSKPINLVEKLRRKYKIYRKAIPAFFKKKKLCNRIRRVRVFLPKLRIDRKIKKLHYLVSKLLKKKIFKNRRLRRKFLKKKFPKVSFKISRYLGTKKLDLKFNSATLNDGILLRDKYRKKKRTKIFVNNKKKNFFTKFPSEIYRRNPLSRFYKVNLEILSITYEYLLNFHTAIGNDYRIWVNPILFSSIIGIRNNMVLFDLSMLFIRLKKGIQNLFQLAKMRGPVMGFIDSSINYKFTGHGFDHFLRMWVGGYLTNYRRVVRNIIALKLKHPSSLTRRQTKFLAEHFFVTTVNFKYYTSFFRIKPKFKKHGGIPPKDKMKERIPAIPEFSLCLEDNTIWVNECSKIGIPNMCVCDSQSFPNKIAFPIIANQRSLHLSFFLVKMILETIMCGKRIDYYSFIGTNYVSRLLRKV